MDQITSMLDDIKRMRKRQVAIQVLNFALIVCSALMIWKSLMLVTHSESPIVVVLRYISAPFIDSQNTYFINKNLLHLSGSMEPAFYRGDLLFLTLTDEPFRVGDIVVFKIEGKEIPIVHRVLHVHEKKNGEVDILTKGDNNQVDDRGLYAPGQLWLNKHHIIGRAKAYLPYVGMVTIIMNDYPQLKYLLIAVMGFFVLVNRE